MEQLKDIGGIASSLPQQDIEALIAAAVPTGGVLLEQYPFDASDVPHYHLMLDPGLHPQVDQVEAIRHALRNAFEATNAQRSSLAIKIVYW